MAVSSFSDLIQHVEHKVVVVTYGDFNEKGWQDWNVAIECEDCGEVLLDFDNGAAEGEVI